MNTDGNHGYYGYFGNAPLGKERCGTDGKFLRLAREKQPLTTDQGARRAAARFFGQAEYRLYRFTNFYDNRTFKELTTFR